MNPEQLNKINPSAPSLRPRLSQDEHKLIRNTFKDEWFTLTIIRDVLFGFPLTEIEKGVIKSFSPEVKRLLKKVLYPTLQKSDPIGTSRDLWFVASNNIKGEEYSDTLIKKATDQTIKFVLEGLARIDNPELSGPNLDCNLGRESFFFVARQNYINGIDQQLVAFNMLAYQTEETDKEKAERLKKDSSK